MTRADLRRLVAGRWAIVRVSFPACTCACACACTTRVPSQRARARARARPGSLPSVHVRVRVRERTQPIVRAPSTRCGYRVRARARARARGHAPASTTQPRQHRHDPHQQPLSFFCRTRVEPSRRHADVDQSSAFHCRSPGDGMEPGAIGPRRLSRSLRDVEYYRERSSLELIAKFTIARLQRIHDSKGEAREVEGASIHVEFLVIQMSVLHSLLSARGTVWLRKRRRPQTRTSTCTSTRTRTGSKTHAGRPRATEQNPRQ